MSRIEELATKILEDISGLPEDRMRLESLGNKLLPLSPEDAAGFFDILCKKSRRHNSAGMARSVLVEPGPVRSYFDHRVTAHFLHLQWEGCLHGQAEAK